MNRPSTEAVLLTAILLLPGTALALASDSRQPIRISADRVELDERSGVSTYTGSVRLEQGSLLLESAALKVFRQNDTLQRVEADGSPARFRQRPEGSAEDVRGTASHIEYHAESGVAVLEGDAQVWKGLDQFTGEHIEYDTGRSVVRARGGDQGRVHAIIHPKEKPEDGASSGE